MFTNINKELLIYLNSLGNNTIIEQIVKIFADGPIFFLPLFLVFMWIYYSIKKINKKEQLLFIFYSTIVSIFITFIIQNLIHIDRPETVIKGVGKLLIQHIPNASFPSDHASVSFAFLTGLYLANYKKIFWFYMPFVIIMNLSRIIAGVHWPFDILIGSLVGISGAIISFKLLTKYKFVNNLNKIIIKLTKYIKL